MVKCGLNKKPICNATNHGILMILKSMILYKKPADSKNTYQPYLVITQVTGLSIAYQNKEVTGHIYMTYTV